MSIVSKIKSLFSSSELAKTLAKQVAAKAEPEVVAVFAKVLVAGVPALSSDAATALAKSLVASGSPILLAKLESL